MAKEHEAGKRSISEIFKFSTRELEEIFRKIDTIKTSTEVQKDKTTLSNILIEAQNNFNRQWEERKMFLTRYAKYRLFSSEIENMSSKIDDVMGSLKIRTSLEESLMSVNSASHFVGQLESSKVKVCFCVSIFIVF